MKTIIQKEREMTIQKLKESITRLEEAQKIVCEAVKIAFPEGATVYFEKGRGKVTAQIVGNNYSWWSNPECRVG